MEENYRVWATPETVKTTTLKQRWQVGFMEGMQASNRAITGVQEGDEKIEKRSDKQKLQRSHHSSPSTSHHPSWMDLPLEMLLLIFRKLTLMDIVENCGNTCRSWRKAAEAILSSGLPLRISLSPSMYISRMFESDAIVEILGNGDSSFLTKTWPQRTNRYNFINIRDHSVQGWLILNKFHHVSNNNKKDRTFSELFFFNPFSRVIFKLPKFFLFSWTSPLYSQVRVVFNSAPPGSEEFVVVFLFVFSYDNRYITSENMKQRLAFFKFKQGSWIKIKSIGTKKILYDIAVDDDDKLYGLTYKHNTGVVFVLSLKDHHHERLVLLNTIEDINFDHRSDRRHQMAMNPSTGELLLVHRVETRCSCCYSFCTEGFRVFKLERSSLRWCEVFDIGDNFLLWDHTRVGVVSTKRLTLPEQFKGGNCIFFCHKDGDHDMGVFFLADRTIIRSPKTRNVRWWSSFQVEDMWFTPAP